MSTSAELPNPKVISPTLTVLPVVLFNFIIYFVIGLPNAIVGALFVHKALGFSTAIAGLTVTTQYLGTFGTRLITGQLVDKYGPKKILSGGLIVCAVSGILMVISALFASHYGADADLHNTSVRMTALILVLLSRLLIGWAESWTATSVTTWNMRRVGREHTSVAISWNGVTTYSGIGIGAALGQWLADYCMKTNPWPSMQGLPAFGLLPIGVAAIVLAGGAFLLLLFYTGVPPLPAPKGGRMTFAHALKLVYPFGTGLAAGSFGFGSVNAFLALYYQANSWTQYGGFRVAFIVFSAFFIGTRLCGTSFIDKRGGLKVGMISLGVEVIAFSVLCLVPTPIGALIGVALTAVGFSLVFPALGTEAVKMAGPASSGILLAAYSVFTDLTIFIVGPLMGFVKDMTGWPVMFATVAAICLLGIVLTLALANGHIEKYRQAE